MDIKKQNIPNSFYTKLAIIWFKGDWGEDEKITDDHKLKNYFQDITLGYLYGDDNIIYQERAEPILDLLKEYCLIPEEWDIEDVRANGRKMNVREWEKAFQSPGVQKAFNNLVDLVGEFVGGYNEKVQFANVHRDLLEQYKTEKLFS